MTGYEQSPDSGGPEPMAIGAFIMELKSREELATIVMEQVRKTVICHNLTAVAVGPFGHDGDWEIKHHLFNGALSDECKNELTTIVFELKKQYRLK